MGMSIQSGDGDGEGAILSEINTTPLVDVMLVLLIIFLITIPVITRTVKLDLPKASNIATQTKPENITVAVDARGNVYWNEGLVPNQQALSELIRATAVVQPQPEIHVRGDRMARFESVGRVILQLQRGGIQKVGFISEPNRGSR
jgi:biopolymer transport protein ExbD